MSIKHISVSVGQKIRRVLHWEADHVVDLTDEEHGHLGAGLHEDSHSTENDPTVAQKCALIGTEGTPSSANPYVTDEDPRLSDHRYPTAHPESVPGGGIFGQVLGKKSAEDFDTEWVDRAAAINGMPAGGELGTVLKKRSGTNYDTEWVAPEEVAIHHGGTTGLDEDDHPQYILHSLATAIGDFLVASAPGAYVKKTLAEVKVILGLAEDYAPIASGVTDGDLHDHSDGNGAIIAHEDLSGIGVNTHDQIDTALAAIMPIPIGGCIEYSGDIAPNANWLIANGAAVSRETYSALFAIAGTKYGAGNGTTTFNIPDRRKRVGVGLDTTDTGVDPFNDRGKTGGAKTVTLGITQVPAHTHTHGGAGRGAATVFNGVNGDIAAGNNASFASNVTSSSGGGLSHQNLPPYIVMNYLIRVA